MLLSSLAALWDTSLGRIPNRLLGYFWLAGLALDPQPVYVLRSMSLLLFLYPLAACRMLGAGDAKLLAVIGGYLGVFPALWVLAAACVLGLLGSLLRRPVRAFWRRRLSYLFHYVLRLWSRREWLPYAPPEPAEGRIPLALPVLGGVLAFLFWKGAGA